MTDTKSPGKVPHVSTDSATKAPKSPRPVNPVWKMMGLPNMRIRLPSRNWLIFLSIAGSFSAAVIFDKREKKRAQRKWCKLVEPLALEPLDPRAMPRRLTVYLEAPPTDGLRVAQDHFKEYVKPILVSSGLDWEFVQGRKEGDIRAELAGRIRKFRTPTEEAFDDEDATTRIRRLNGVTEFDGPQGDIIIGRHTWKEYIRGLHEGWLGPLSGPAPVEPQMPLEATQSKEPHDADIQTEGALDSNSLSTPVDSQSNPAADAVSLDPSNDKPKKPSLPPPLISTAEYQSAPIPAKIPSSFDLSIPISFPHILGFSHTPLRLYRFLNRRHLADSIGRETAAIVLSNSRKYHENFNASNSSFSQSEDSFASNGDDSQPPEQVTALAEEEKDWHKSIYKHQENEPERTWLNEIVLDPRISRRMQRAELTKEDEETAQRIVISEEEIEGWIKGSFRAIWRSGKAYAGFEFGKKQTGKIIEEKHE